MTRHILVSIALLLALLLLTSCASLSDRYSSYDQRHPCSNIWNICPGQYEWLDRVRWVLEGQN